MAEKGKKFIPKMGNRYAVRDFCNNSPSYNISKLLDEILAPVVLTYEYKVLNSFDFVEMVKSVHVPPDYTYTNFT